MADSGPVQRARENATGIVSVLVTGTWLVALFTGQSWWLPFMLFGYIVIVPMTAMLFGDESDVEQWWDDADVSTSEESTSEESTREESTTGESTESTDEALQTLRDRYARGEITEAQFERKLERLLETETVEDLEERERLRERE